MPSVFTEKLYFMRTKIIISLFFLLSGFYLQAQKMKPSKKEALIEFQLTDSKQEPIDLEVFFYGKKTKKVYSIDAKGSQTNQILLPNADTYVIYTQKAPGSFEIPISSRKNLSFALALDFDILPDGKLSPTPVEALVKTILLDSVKIPQQQSIYFTGKTTGKKYIGQTNKNGGFEILLPIKQSYRVDIGNTINYSELKIPDIKFFELEKVIQFESGTPEMLHPSLDSALFNISYRDLNDKMVIDEIFTVKAKRTGKVYSTKSTDKNGLVQIKVPLGDKYTVSAKYYPDFDEQILSTKPELIVLDLSLKFISSKEFEKRKRKREREIAIRDSLYEDLLADLRIRDSLWLVKKAARRRQDSLQNPKLYQYYDSLQKAGWNEGDIKNIEIAQEEKKRIIVKSEQAAEKLKENPDYFEAVGMEVCAVMHRLKDSWNKKIIITDLTCSMYPYFEQLMLWHSLQQNKKDNYYIFFNDGDGIPNDQKTIGSTGGIHQTEKSDLLDIILKMKETTSTGCSGDSPENDLEAVIEGVKVREAHDEIILIADNYSDVRDIILLKEIDIPVHIILCGVASGSLVHEQYLDIAYHTKGSVHTIEEDIFNLSKISEGKTITIGGKIYKLCNGRFIRVTKS